MSIKIYEMNDTDWVAASSPEEATAFYIAHCGSRQAADGAGGCDPRSLSEEEMGRIKHMGVDWRRASWPKDRVPSFREELADMVAAGDKFPCLFASSEY